MRVILDTNIHVSSLISRRGVTAAVLEQCGSPHLLLASSESITELKGKLEEPKFERYFTQEEANSYLHDYLDRVTMYDTPDIPPVCADPDDDYLFALALIGEADYLVSGDKQVLALDPYGKTRVVTPRQFLDLTVAS